VCRGNVLLGFLEEDKLLLFSVGFVVQPDVVDDALVVVGTPLAHLCHQVRDGFT
jgi:hypothetical protein